MLEKHHYEQLISANPNWHNGDIAGSEQKGTPESGKGGTAIDDGSKEEASREGEIAENGERSGRHAAELISQI